MIAWRRFSALLFVVSASFPLVTGGQELDEAAVSKPQSWDNPKSNLVDSDFRALNDFSFTDGVASLVQATRSWREQRNCISCHTTGWGLAAQPIIDPRSAEVVDGRAFAQNYLTKFISKLITILSLLLWLTSTACSKKLGNKKRLLFFG